MKNMAGFFCLSFMLPLISIFWSAAAGLLRCYSRLEICSLVLFFFYIDNLRRQC